MYTVYFIFVALFVAYSQQVPVDEEVVRVKKAADGLLAKDEKLNNSASAGNMMSLDRFRTAMYPLSGGYGYHSVGQTFLPLPHYPNGWPVQQFQGQLPAGVQFKNDMGENMNARTFGHGSFKPQLYSQYQVAAPQVYSAPHAYIQPVEYSTPYYSSHYSGYSGYPSYYRDAGEEEKTRQYMPMNFANSDKVMSPVYYTTKFLMEKPSPLSGMQSMQQMTQSQMMQPMTPMFVRAAKPESEIMVDFQGRDATGADNLSGSSYKILPATFGYPALNELRGRDITVDDKLQMQIPANYLQNRLQYMNPLELFSQTPQVHSYAGRAAEEPKPMENWQQPIYDSNTVFKNSNQLNQNQDPYITPEDHVYMEPFIMPEHQSRAAEQGMIQNLPMYGYPTYPNLRQQLRNFQLQNYFNTMNHNAGQLENLSMELNKEREWINSNTDINEKNAKASESASLTQLIRDVVHENIKNTEEKTKTENKEVKDDAKTIAKDVKKDGNTALPKANENVGAMFASNTGRHI